LIDFYSNHHKLADGLALTNFMALSPTLLAVARDSSQVDLSLIHKLGKRSRAASPKKVEMIPMFIVSFQPAYIFV
jgi:hypothetical protein